MGREGRNGRRTSAADHVWTSCDSEKVFVLEELADGGNGGVCVCCFCPGADSVVTPLSFQGAGAAWEKPSRTQQTGLTHSHIIRLCTATRPTDHRDQESARSGNTGAGLVSLLV